MFLAGEMYLGGELANPLENWPTLSSAAPPGDPNNISVTEDDSDSAIHPTLSSAATVPNSGGCTSRRAITCHRRKLRPLGPPKPLLASRLDHEAQPW